MSPIIGLIMYEHAAADYERRCSSGYTASSRTPIDVPLTDMIHGSAEGVPGEH